MTVSLYNIKKVKNQDSVTALLSGSRFEDEVLKQIIMTGSPVSMAMVGVFRGVDSGGYRPTLYNVQLRLYLAH